MAKLTTNCPLCHKPLVLVSEAKTSATEVFRAYKCGHAFTEIIEAPKELKFKCADLSKTYEARDYQKKGVDFIVNGAEGNSGGFNCIIGDQMRLGKTPQALLALANAYEERTPCLILVRSANLWQWIAEYKVWTDTLPLGIYPIVGTKSFIPPGFSAYIMSMDTFSRGDMVEKLLTFGFKLVIVDEAHSFKNTASKRSQALIQFLHEISKAEITITIPFRCLNCQEEWNETIVKQITKQDERISKSAYCPACNSFNQQSAFKEKIDTKRKCGVIMLTGTAIKNRADEYFVPLNICAPDRFSSIDQFRKQWLTKDATGKYSRVNPYRLDEFKRVIAPYVLRREKEDVYTDLPAINRMYTVITIDDERLKKAYNDVLDRLEQKMDSKSNFTYFDSIGELQILRQICGIAKVPFVSNYIQATLDEGNESDKIAVGIHHHAVRDALKAKLEDYGVLSLSGEDSAERKYWIMKHFETSADHVLVLNMLAGGVGMDFHYCHDVKILERQWSHADEEQFEFRFYNPDKSIQGNHTTNIEYILAKGTIDNWFHDLVENKKFIQGETIGTNWDLKSNPMLFRELVEQTVSNRL